MANSVTVGLGLAVLGYGGRYVARCRFGFCIKKVWPSRVSRTAPQLVTKLESVTKAIDFHLPKFDMKTWENSKYHKGGFEGKMTRREAALILGISPNSDAKKIRDAHKRVTCFKLQSIIELKVISRWWFWTTPTEEAAHIWRQKSTRPKISWTSRNLSRQNQVFSCRLFVCQLSNVIRIRICPMNYRLWYKPKSKGWSCSCISNPKHNHWIKSKYGFLGLSENWSCQCPCWSFQQPQTY